MLVTISLNRPYVLRGIDPAIVASIKILWQLVNRNDIDAISDGGFNGLLIVFKYIHAIIALDFQDMHND